ncbi:DUF3887 domain-containing protein [Crocosphaera sp. XPORK-15E]|uniref:DUF3887 domain-containing protein n=1 Tax=Crocosphaera sp. XPORK-15E TaxID=3110247 RepID=UPI002B1F2498|nr:DUF3887 domain-containing protein [Crocosphaera sp. XPORK-15E]MEA5536156.1 DUF3887 domain-containing protein [Crocosphaera sp. XPORK-15E]
MNLSLTLKQTGLPLLVLTLVSTISALPAKAQVKLNPPRPVQVVQSGDKVDQEALKKKSAQVIELLTQEKYEDARRLLSRDLAIELTADQMAEIWANLIEVTGPVKKIVGYRVIPTINANIVVVETQFNSKTDEFIITFNQQGDIVGVNFPNVASVDEIAQIVVNAVAANDFARARGYLHPTLKTEILPTRLQTSWQKIQQESGLFERIDNIDVLSSSSVDQSNIVVVEAKFQKGIRTFFFIFDNNSRITGIDLAQ